MTGWMFAIIVTILPATGEKVTFMQLGATAATSVSIAMTSTGTGMICTAIAGTNPVSTYKAINKNAAPVKRSGISFYKRAIYFFNTFAIVDPISAGVCTTVIPHSAMIFILAAAVSSAPPIIAPACPIRLPGGAV